jgi:hypothetical protein
MGPFNEMNQLKRKAYVLAILQRNDLSAWARNYWGTVYDTIAMTEDRYNTRVVNLYKGLDRNA